MKKKQEANIRGRYHQHTPEFKRTALKMYDKYQNASLVAEKLEMSESSLKRWVRQGIERKTSQRFSREKRLQIVREIQSGIYTIEEAFRVYDVVNIQSIKRWVKQFGNEQFSLQKVVEMENLPLDMTTNDVKTLKQALLMAENRIRALETLIEVAEEQLKIEIRKKPGAKQ